MGNIVLRSRALANMSDVEFEDNVDIEEDDLFDDTPDADEALSENHLVSILRQLINRYTAFLRSLYVFCIEGSILNTCFFPVGRFKFSTVITFTRCHYQ